MTDRVTFETRVDALLGAVALKAESRTGWEQHDIDDPESVAAHSWGVALLAVVLADEWDRSLDRQRALELAVVHDLGEAVAGDVPATAPESARRAAAERERATLAGFGEAFGVDLLARYDELQRNETPEARFVHELDKLEMLVQAVSYERAEETRTLTAFFETADASLDSEPARALFDRLTDARPDKNRQGETPPDSTNERANTDETSSRAADETGEQDADETDDGDTDDG